MDDRTQRALIDLRRLQEGYRPSDEELANGPLLNSWCRLGDHLVGVVVGHPVVADGHRCITSPVLALAADGTWARTVSRYYRLGRPMGSSVQ